MLIVKSTIHTGRHCGGFALALLLAVVALMLTCRKWDNPLDPTGNHPPALPSRPSPADLGLRRDSGLVLSWHSLDPDGGDTAYFRIFFDTASSPRMVEDSCTDTTFRPTNVTSLTEYYWQVVAFDNHGDSAGGPLWRFQTAPSISVTAPDSGERLRMYAADTIIWVGGPSGVLPRVLKTDAAGPRGQHSAEMTAADSTVIYRSTDNGGLWIRLGRATTPGQFVWQVPAAATESARVRVWVYAATDTMTGTSGRFAIEDTLTPSANDVTSPAGREGDGSFDDDTVSVLGASSKGSR
jgi:hypothetical protein